MSKKSYERIGRGTYEVFRQKKAPLFDGLFDFIVKVVCSVLALGFWGLIIYSIFNAVFG